VIDKFLIAQDLKSHCRYRLRNKTKLCVQDIFINTNEETCEDVLFIHIRHLLFNCRIFSKNHSDFSEWKHLEIILH